MKVPCQTQNIFYFPSQFFSLDSFWENYNISPNNIVNVKATMIYEFSLHDHEVYFMASNKSYQFDHSTHFNNDLQCIHNKCSKTWGCTKTSKLPQCSSYKLAFVLHFQNNKYPLIWRLNQICDIFNGINNGLILHKDIKHINGNLSNIMVFNIVKCHESLLSFNVMQWFSSLIKSTSWSLQGPRMEVGLTPNIMKGISIFPLLTIGFILFFSNK